MTDFFFDGWESIVRTLLVGVLAYVAIVALLRVSGKRSLSQWNAFDFVVTVAFGSTLATVILSPDVPLGQGIAAFLVLIGCQAVVSWLSVGSRSVHQMIKNRPTLLLYRGEFLRDAMRRERVTESEMWAALRAGGSGSKEEVDAIVLETDGRLSIIQNITQGKSILTNVEWSETELPRARSKRRD